MSKKVLVVDDSATVRQQVSLALEQAGFEMVEAVDGVDGLDKVTNTSDIGLVICDVNMPRMNGLEMIEKIKETSVGNGAPIIMLTTEGAPDLIKRAKKAGVKGWIVKPFRADLLVSAATKLTGS